MEIAILKERNDGQYKIQTAVHGQAEDALSLGDGVHGRRDEGGLELDSLGHAERKR